MIERKKFISGTVTLKNPIWGKNQDGELKRVKRFSGTRMEIAETDGQCFVRLPDTPLYFPIEEAFDSL